MFCLRYSNADGFDATEVNSAFHPSELGKSSTSLGGVVVRSRTSDSEVAGSSPARTAVE